MRTVFLIAVALVALIVLAALVVPAVIDWSRYKGEIIGRAEQATGRRVEIAGPVGLRLLPSPAFTAERLAIANPEGAEGRFATADKLAVRLRLAPLLTGKVVIDSLVVDRPVITLARLPDGRPNWKFEPKAKEKPDEAKTETPGSRPAEEGIPVGEVQVRNGTLTYAGGGAPIEVTNIDARLDAAGAEGPFHAKGTMRVHGSRVEVEAGLDRVAEKRGSPARATVRIPDVDARAEFSGLLTRLSEGESVHGNLTVSAADLNRLAALTGTALPLAPGTGAKIESTLTASTSEASLTNLVAMVGDTRIGGQIAARFQDPATVTVNLDAPTVDLDRLLAAEPARQAASSAAPSPAPKATEGGKPAAGGTFGLPTDLKVDSALAVGTLQWRGQVVREARVDASLDQGMVVINGATAQLPGGSVASLSGVLAAEDGRPRFDGQFEARSDNARGLLAWLGVDAAGIPEDRLRRLEASAAIHALPPEWGLHDLSIHLDATTVRGTASARLTSRPAYNADLRADTLNLDAYRAKPGAAEPATEPQPAPAPSAGNNRAATSPPANPLRPLAEFDGTFKLAADHLTLNGVAAEGAKLSARLDNGLLAVTDLGVEIAGTRARGQARIGGLATASPRVEEANFRLDSSQPARLFQFLGVHALADSRLGALAAQGRLEGDWNNIALDGRAEAGGLVLTAQGSLASPLERPSYRLTVQASHDNFVQLVRLWAPNYRPGGPVGPFALGAKVAGGPQTVDVTGLDLRAGATRLTGEAHVALGGARPRLTADLAGGAIALDPFLPGEKTGALQPGRGGASDPRIQMPPTLPAAVGPAAGPGPWSHEPMDLAVLNAFDARIGLHADSVKWGAWTLEAAQTTVVVENGTAAVDKLTGRLLGGALNVGARLSHTGALAADFAIEGANLAQTKLGAGGIAVTQGRLNADAQLTATGRSTYELAQRLQGGGKLLVTDGVISGFDLPAVNKQLNNIENVGSLLGLVQAGLSGGSTRFTRLAGTFAADKGVVTSRDLKLDAEGGGATAETTLNLPPWTMQTAVHFRLADSSAPPLGLRLEGPIDNPRKIIDVNALQQFLVSRGLGRALSGKNGGDLLGGLLGGKQQPPAPAPGTSPQPGQQQPGKTKPKDVLKDLLKGLGGQ